MYKGYKLKYIISSEFNPKDICLPSYVDEVIVIGQLKDNQDYDSRFVTYNSPTKKTPVFFSEYYVYAIEKYCIYIRILKSPKADIIETLLQTRIKDLKSFIVSIEGVAFSFFGDDLNKIKGVLEVYADDNYSGCIHRVNIGGNIKNIANDDIEWLFSTYPTRIGKSNYIIKENNDL